MGFYCFQDKDGHCQDKHATYHETSGGSYDGDSGGGSTSMPAGQVVGGLILFAAVGALIYGAVTSLNDWLELKQSRATSSESTLSSRSQSRGYYVSREEVDQPISGVSRRNGSQREIDELLFAAKGKDDRPFLATTIWKDGSFPGVTLTEGSDSIAFNLRSNATIGNGLLELPIPSGWSKNFHFPNNAEFTCSIVCGGCDLVFIDKDGLAVATIRTDASVHIDHFLTRSFSVRAHEYNGSMIVTMSRPKNADIESKRKKAQFSSADSSDRATSQPISGSRGYYVSREEVNRFQLELDRKKAQSSSLRLRELDEQYASEEMEFDREIERVKKETASLLPKLDEQYAAKVREFKEALRLNDFELAKRKDAESLQLLDKRNALEVEGATRVNEILKQKLAAIKAAIERIRAD